MHLDKHSATPIYLQLEAVLREQIQRGILQPGSKLPSETDLAAEFGVGRSTLRKVLERLVLANLITKWPGKGSFVAVPRLSLSPSTLSFHSQMTAAGHVVTSRVLLREVIPAPARVAQALNLPTESQVIHLRRLRLLDGEPVAIHSAYLPYPSYDRISSHDLQTRSLSEAMERATGARVVSSRDVLRVTAAEAEEAALLDIPVRSPVVVLRGVDYADLGLAVRYSEGMYRSDRFDFVVDNFVPDGRRTSPEPT
jgi:GntR family transcriptional regulator